MRTKRLLKTRLAGCCACSTEYSDLFLEIVSFFVFFFKLCRFLFFVRLENYYKYFTRLLAHFVRSKLAKMVYHSTQPVD